MFAIPKPGRTVPIPGSRKLLAPAGQNIGQVTQYWHHRHRDGDVTLSQTAPVAAPAASVPSPSSAPASATAPTATATTSTSAAATTPSASGPAASASAPTGSAA